MFKRFYLKVFMVNYKLKLIIKSKEMNITTPLLFHIKNIKYN